MALNFLNIYSFCVLLAPLNILRNLLSVGYFFICLFYAII
jgi:hypothetical protein